MGWDDDPHAPYPSRCCDGSNRIIQHFSLEFELLDKDSSKEGGIVDWWVVEHASQASTWVEGGGHIKYTLSFLMVGIWTAPRRGRCGGGLHLLPFTTSPFLSSKTCQDTQQYCQSRVQRSSSPSTPHLGTLLYTQKKVRLPSLASPPPTNTPTHQFTQILIFEQV